MPLSIDINIDLFDDFIDTYNTMVRGAVRPAAEEMLSAMIYQFETEGAAYGYWMDLSPITIALKKFRGAPYPSRKLYEFGDLMNSLSIQDQSTDQNIQYGIGIFNYAPTGLYKSPGADDDDPWKTVSRAYIHEFGGWELKPPSRILLEEIITRRLHHAALMGYSFIARAEWEVRKKIADSAKYKGRMVYIPRRSFIADPFDAIEGSLVRAIAHNVNEIFEAIL